MNASRVGAVNVPAIYVPEHIDVAMSPEYLVAAPILWISNVVVTFSLNIWLSPTQLAKMAPGISINPKRFVAGTARTWNGVVLIFSSGRVVCAGADSVFAARNTALDITATLLRCGLAVRYSNFNLENIVCYANSGFYVDLVLLAAACPTDAHYIPEQFPGLTFRFRTTPITILVFPAGSAIITGSRDKKDSERHWAWFHNEVLVRCRMNANEAQSAAHYRILRLRQNDTSAEDMWNFYLQHQLDAEKSERDLAGDALVWGDLDALMDKCRDEVVGGARDDWRRAVGITAPPLVEPKILDIRRRMAQIESSKAFLADLLPGGDEDFSDIMCTLGGDVARRRL